MPGKPHATAQHTSRPSDAHHPAVLETSQLDAILFDLDGVVTQTAAVHAAAWKQLFDAYLARRAQQTGETYRPFDIDTDYAQLVDGKPRYDGVRSCLASRQITLPDGYPDDPPDQETVCGLGNAKQRYFAAQLQEKGVAVYDSTLDFIQQARAQGLKVAVISSSKNCASVLRAAGLTDLFEARVDGVEMARLGLSGKPAADVFLEAAQRLDVDPARAAVIEDALAGVQAGRAGGFACVIGIDRHGERAEDFHAHGATIVVQDLAALRLGGRDAAAATADPAHLPNALAHVEDIMRQAARKRLVVFLDYDGTLTPIVERPDAAHLSDAMRTALADLAGSGPGAIVSGRDLQDVRARVGLDALYYAGSHGFEIAGPRGLHTIYAPAAGYLPDLQQAETLLRRRCAGLAGVLVERKRFAIAVHFRRASAADAARVAAIVDEVRQAHRRLRQTGGKKVLELRPDLDWHKGTALFWLLEVMGLERQEVLPLYIGDDVTDEDAFTALRHTGVGIIVSAGSEHATAAHYGLDDTPEVRTFLQRLTERRRRSQQS